MVSCKQLFVNWFLISHDPAGRLASACREYLGGSSSSTKDDGGKHLRALPAPNQEGSEDMFLGSSTFKNPVEVPVSDLLFDKFLVVNSDQNKTKPLILSYDLYLGPCHRYECRVYPQGG